MPVDDLKVPFAYLKDGTVVRPEDADRTADYFCPGCEEPLVYRSGARVRPHFAHRAGGPCASYETILHHVAKNKLAERISQSIKGEAPRQVFKRECPMCGVRCVEQGVPASVASVRLETDEKSGYRPDLTLYDADSRTLCAVEVYVTSTVGGEKAEGMGLPWIEIRAEEIMAGLERPDGLYEVHRDSLPQAACGRCASGVFSAYREAVDVLRRWGLDWPPGPYQVSYGECWKCDEEIPFFSWESLWSESTPPEPRPRTVQYRYSRVTRSKYWANTCPKCRRIQGDWFVFHEPGGAFFPAYEEGKSAFVDAQRRGNLDPATGRLCFR